MGVSKLVFRTFEIGSQDTQAEIRLYCGDNAADMTDRDWHEFRIAPPEAVDIYAKAWLAAVNGAEAVDRFNRENMAGGEDILHKAMIRYGEDHPADGSLPRSARQVLDIIGKHGPSDRRKIFSLFKEYEEHSFMGDAMLQRLLNRMVENNIIICESGQYRRKAD